MSYQKLQGNRWLKVIPSDTIPIPNPSTEVTSSTATATTSNKLVDSTKDFTVMKLNEGDIIYNDTDSTIATVTAVDSATTLSVSADIFANTEAYTIYRAPTTNDAPVLFIGGAGTAQCVSIAGDSEQFTFVAGTYVPLNVRRVDATGTSATLIKAIW